MVDRLACLMLLLAVSSGELRSEDRGDLQYPLDVAAASDDTVYIADRNLPGIWIWKEGRLSKFFTGSKTFRTPLNAVRCIAVSDDGTLYAGDSSTREVYRFDADRQPVPLSGGSIGIPADLLVEDEQIIVSDLELQRIWTLPRNGGDPKELAVVAGVRGLARHTDGDLLCVTTLEDPVRKISSDGKLAVLIPGRPFQMPHHAVLMGENLFVADNYATTIWKASLQQGAMPEALVQGAPLVRPVGLCRQGDDLLVADPHARDVFRVTSTGEVVSIFE